MTAPMLFILLTLHDYESTVLYEKGLVPHIRLQHYDHGGSGDLPPDYFSFHQGRCGAARPALNIAVRPLQKDNQGLSWCNSLEDQEQSCSTRCLANDHDKYKDETLEELTAARSSSSLAHSQRLRHAQRPG